jgi:hypothetical protein
VAEPDVTVITTSPVLRHVGRLEIRDDRITYLLFADRGDGKEIARATCRGMTLTGSGKFRRLKVVGPDRNAGSLSLFGLDLERVRQATLAHGWPWESTDTGPAPAPARRSTEIVLRQGWASSSRTKWIFRALLLLACVAVMAGMTVGALVLLDRGAWWAVVAWPIGFFALILAASAADLRLSDLAVSIDEERLAVRHGSPVSLIARRSAVRSVRPGTRSAAVRNQAGRKLLKVPLGPRRAEVLGALHARGWPLDERSLDRGASTREARSRSQRAGGGGR